MFRKIILFLLFVALFTPGCFVFANLEINEIMYDLKTGSDDGREWVEIYNNSDVSVDLPSYRLFEADTNHKIKLVEGDTSIPAKGYAIIISSPIKFKTDWSNLFTEPVFVNIFDSSFSLNNDGEVLMIKDKDLKIIDQYTYKSNLGGAGDGKSLQKINGVWQGATPTPGLENKITYVPPAPTPAPKPTPVKKAESVSKNENVIPEETFEEIPSDIPSEVTSGSSDSYFFGIILIPLVIGSAGAVYFIRKKKVAFNPVGDFTKSAGDDFKILDE